MRVDHQWREGLCLALGIGLIVSPLVFGFIGDALGAWHALLAGLALFALAATTLGHPRVWEDALLLVLGVWIAGAPLVLGFGNDTALWVHAVVGVVVALDALWSLVVAWYPPAGRPHA